MLSYRHAYHAGNFADVFKHTLLTLLLDALNRKDKPWCYVDVHAGAGRYDLRSAEAQKNREHVSGIDRLWGCEDPPDAVARYLGIVQAANRGSLSNPRWYPGSPEIARHLMRAQDRMVLNELHSTDFRRLQRRFADDERVAVHHRDGYQALRVCLPPRERRGLTLMDPSFELADELDRMAAALELAHRRFATGVYMLWYPLLARLDTARLHERIAASGIRRVLRAELAIHPEDSPLGLNGSGLIIVNPPYRTDAQLEELLPWLWRRLAPEGQGRYDCTWLVPE